MLSIHLFCNEKSVTSRRIEIKKHFLTHPVGKIAEKAICKSVFVTTVF